MVYNEFHFPSPAFQGYLWVSLAVLSENRRGVITQGNKIVSKSIGSKSRTQDPEGIAEQCWLGSWWLQGPRVSTREIMVLENTDRLCKLCSAVGWVTPTVPVPVQGVRVGPPTLSLFGVHMSWGIPLGIYLPMRRHIKANLFQPPVANTCESQNVTWCCI